MFAQALPFQNMLIAFEAVPPAFWPTAHAVPFGPAAMALR